ncbi:MAG: hypothetical protein CVV27_00580 [Candidatus Melainabacteria bacterium HGW-Melainabacteria-1]|nr:MAG: hypothetical protein CVV27_00580 [Candidatus Melainabacteria bacterium HGW-Melainabacteria-1]
MLLTPALKTALFVSLYAALALLSWHSLWPVLPEPGFAWGLGLGLIPGLLSAGLVWLLGGRQSIRLSGLDWVLLLNALLLWSAMAFQILPGTPA